MMERKQRIRLCWTAALALAAGCTTESGESMVILHNQVPGEGCILSGDPADTFVSRGVIDVAASEGYVFTPVVESRIARNDRLIALRGADVELSFPDSFSADVDEGLIRFSQAFSGTIDPLGTVGLGFVIIPRGLLDEIAGRLNGGSVQVTAEVVVFGDLDGSDVESVPFIYPVDVCEDCLKIDRGECSALPDDFEAEQGGACNPLQDDVADCCTSDGVDVCPAPA
jgi:hypothetical protein